jgi:hypothetical protein
MNETVIERVIPPQKVIPPAGNTPGLIDPMDTVLRDICFELRSVVDTRKQPRGVDGWLRTVRKRFRKSQLKLTDDDRAFRLRVAVPGYGNNLHAMVLAGGIAVRGDDRALIRWVPLSGRVDPDSVSAIFDGGFLHMTGSKTENDAFSGVAP